MRRRLCALFLTLAPLALFGASCGGTPSTLCNLECDCEHCSDIKKDYVCEQAEAMQSVAEAYDCSDQYDDWAKCVEDKGTCDDTGSRLHFTTQVKGSCSGSYDTMYPCTTTGDCSSFSGATCSGGKCLAKACAGTNQQCTSDSDCSSGEDRCQSQAEKLGKCEADAAKDPRYGGGITQTGGGTAGP